MTADVLQGLYNSAINFKLSTFWDGGFDWWLGDEMNGYKAEGNGDTLEDAIGGLLRAVKKYYPNSWVVKKCPSVFDEACMVSPLCPCEDCQEQNDIPLPPDRI